MHPRRSNPAIFSTLPVLPGAGSFLHGHGFSTSLSLLCLFYGRPPTPRFSRPTWSFSTRRRLAPAQREYEFEGYRSQMRLRSCFCPRMPDSDLSVRILFPNHEGSKPPWRCRDAASQFLRPFSGMTHRHYPVHDRSATICGFCPASFS